MVEDQEQFKEYNIMDYLSILYKRKKKIILYFFLVCFLALPVSLIWPKKYKSTAVIMPPKPQGGLLPNISLRVPSLLSLGGLAGSSDELLSFLAILKSTTLAEKIIEQYNLIERYDSKNIEEAVKSFHEDQNIILNEENTVSIEIFVSTGFFHPQEQEDEAKQLCAKIANSVVEEMNKIYTSLKTQQAGYNRAFLEKRYMQNKKDILELEESIKEFSEKYGIISLTDQLEASVSIAAQLELEKIEKEIILSGLKQYLDMSNPEI